MIRKIFAVAAFTLTLAGAPVDLPNLAVGQVVLPMAEAGGCEPNCNQPTAVKRGQKVPVWKVAYCVIGKPGKYRKINCQDPRAKHRSPLGNIAVCFVGTDNKVHWDYQWAVHEGREFINHKVNGRWQPDWRDDHSKWQK